MGKIAERRGKSQTTRDRQKLLRLKGQRRKLATRLAKVDAAIAGLRPDGTAKPVKLEEFDRWFDELAEGLPPLPPLPADFSRADLYDDHD